MNSPLSNVSLFQRQIRTVMTDKVSLETIGDIWKTGDIPCQVIVCCTHAIVCRVSLADREETYSSAAKSLLKCPHKSESTPIERRREAVRMLQGQYYAEIAKSQDLNNLEYFFDESSSILKVRNFNLTQIYGYQYLAQAVIFSPALTFDGSARRILSSVNQRYVSFCDHNVNHAFVRQIAALFGRRLHVFTAGCRQDLTSLAMATLTCGTWLAVGPAETMTETEKSFFLELVQQVRCRMQFGGNHVDVKGRKIHFAEGFHFGLTRWSSDVDIGHCRTLFREISLVPFPRKLQIRWAVQQKSTFDSGDCQEMELIADEIERKFPNQSAVLQHKLMVAVRQSSTEGISDIYSRLVANQDVLKAVQASGAAALSPSLKEAVRAVSESNDDEVDLEMDHFVQLQTSLKESPVTIVKASFSALETRMISLIGLQTEKDGKRFLCLDFETQMKDSQFVGLLTSGSRNLLENSVLVIFGWIEQTYFEVVKHSVRETNYANMEVLVFDANYQNNFGPGMEEANWIDQKQDKWVIMRRVLSQRAGQDILALLPKDALEEVIGVIGLLVEVDNELHSDAQPLAEVTLAAVLAVSLRDQDEHLRRLKSGDDDAKSFNQILCESLVTTLSYLVSAQRLKSLATTLKGKESPYDVFAKMEETALAVQRSRRPSLRPQMSVAEQNSELYVPTNEQERVVRSMRYLLKRGVGVLIRGQKASGKSTAIKHAIHQTKLRTINLYLGETDFKAEDMVSIYFCSFG